MPGDSTLLLARGRPSSGLRSTPESEGAPLMAVQLKGEHKRLDAPDETRAFPKGRN